MSMTGTGQALIDSADVDEIVVTDAVSTAKICPKITVLSTTDEWSQSMIATEMPSFTGAAGCVERKLHDLGL